MIIYVDASVIQTGNGTKENPFKTIQEAAAKALPGDEVIVAPGLYREAVNPIHAGTADKRITYRSAIKGQAHITGSEAVKDWENVEGTVRDILSRSPAPCGASPAGVFLFGRSFCFQGAVHR